MHSDQIEGICHVVRNLAIHEIRMCWDVNEDDTVDILIEISCLHKLLDRCVAVPRNLD